MKKSLLVISVLLTVLVTLSIAGFAYAQSNTPLQPLRRPTAVMATVTECMAGHAAG